MAVSENEPPIVEGADVVVVGDGIEHERSRLTSTNVRDTRLAVLCVAYRVAGAGRRNQQRRMPRLTSFVAVAFHATKSSAWK